jgi:Fe2+ or Zn2+ uptake regulation protein
MSKATVYRNLAQMAEAGELLNIGSFNGSAHYDHNCYDHYHFVCTECGQIFDSPIGEAYADVLRNLTTMEGFRTTGYSLSFTGVCKGCAESKS